MLMLAAICCGCARMSAGRIAGVAPTAAPTSGVAVTNAAALRWRRSVPRVEPARDPFHSADAPADEATTAAPNAGAVPIFAPVAGIGQSTAPAGMASASPAGETVVGVLVGQRSYAIVRSAGNTRVVGVGELLWGRRIASVGITGVQLSDGTVVRVDSGIK